MLLFANTSDAISTGFCIAVTETSNPSYFEPDQRLRGCALEASRKEVLRSNLIAPVSETIRNFQ